MVQSEVIDNIQGIKKLLTLNLIRKKYLKMYILFKK